jgi:hypothetical protein
MAKSKSQSHLIPTLLTGDMGCSDYSTATCDSDDVLVDSGRTQPRHHRQYISGNACHSIAEGLPYGGHELD